jgi:putative Mn2+ efflux pump MntP
MHWLTLLALAVGLAMDATTVAVASAMSARRVRPRDALLLASLFGLFQAVMPWLGWVVGLRFEDAIEAWDHWVAFALLAGIGGKMVHEALTAGHGTEEAGGRDPFQFGRLLVMALATSVDALAAGFTLPLLDVPVVAAVAVIGGVTFVLCLLGAELGQRFGARLGGKLDLLGGVVLIGLGVKTLVEHLAGRGAV